VAAANLYHKVLCFTSNYITDSLKPFLLNGIPLPVHQSVRDLGVIVNDSLTPSSHRAEITATAYQHINLIFRCFVLRDVPMLLHAYTTYIRPLLQYRGRGATGSRGSIDPHFFRCGVHIWRLTPHFCHVHLCPICSCSYSHQNH